MRVPFGLRASLRGGISVLLGLTALSILSLAALVQPGHVGRFHSVLEAAPPPVEMAGAAERPRSIVKILSSVSLPDMPGKKVTTVLIEFPPGGYSPPHHHGGSVTVYVLSGAIRSQLEGGPIETFPAGGTFFEPLGVTHLLAENASITEPARFLAVFVADEGAVLTTYHE